MPIDYKKYPHNWKTEIRPRILKRAENKCECCGVQNYMYVFRCYYHGVECYQDGLGNLYDASDSTLISKGTEYFNLNPLAIDRAIKIVLTIAHLNHDITDNRDENLKAMCQRCHLRYDASHKAIKRKQKKNQIDIKF